MNTSRGARISGRAMPVIGIVVACAAAVALGLAMVRTWSDVQDAVASATWGWLVAALVLAVAAMTCVALPWRRAMAILGGQASWFETIAWYFVGEIGKYLPGGVWPVLGRSEMARRAGVTPAAAYGGVVLSLGALYLCAGLCLIAFSPVLVAGRGVELAIASSVVVLVGLAALHPAALGHVARLLARVSKGRIDVVPPPWHEVVGLVLRYLPAWVLIGTTTWCVTRAFDATAELHDIWPAAVASWLAGFLAVPVPGGVGVREAVFVALAPDLSSGVAAAVAVAARLAFMITDAAGAALGTALLSSRRSSGRAQGRRAAVQVGDGIDQGDLQ